MNKIKFIGLMLLTMLLAGCASRVGGELAPDADPANLPAIEGDYALNGVDQLGNEYGGRLAVRAGGAEGMYTFQWLVSESIQEGIGFVNGNQVEITWQTIADFPNPIGGTAIYTITQAGELYGTKIVEGQAGEAQEVAYPNSGDNMK